LKLGSLSPAGLARLIALAATYIVVLFSVIVQGGTIERVLDRARRSGMSAADWGFASYMAAF
jgi:NhaP-type Na+/H+ or K+/H+ antiporter